MRSLTLKRKSPEEIRAKLVTMGLFDEVNDHIRTKYGLVSVGSLAELSRHPHIIDARAWLMHLLRSRYKWSYPVIGHFFGLDHTSVMMAMKRYAKRHPDEFPSSPDV